MKTFMGIALALVGLLGPVAPALAQMGGDDSAPDSRVKAVLDAGGLKYKINSNKNFSLLYDTTDGRTQQVIIHSDTEHYGKFEIREVTSAGYKVKGKLNAEVANRLLEASQSNKLGFWVTLYGDDETLALFTVRLAADANLEAIKNALDNAVTSADKMEEELTHTDDF